METITLQTDIHVLCVQAETFPNGIMQAYQTLGERLLTNPNRLHYGLSHGTPTGEVIYFAAAEQLQPNEPMELNLIPKIIPAGNYACITVLNYMQNLPSVAQTFRTLLALPNHDTNGMCVEQYINQNDVECMLRLVE